MWKYAKRSQRFSPKKNYGGTGGGGRLGGTTRPPPMQRSAVSSMHIVFEVSSSTRTVLRKLGNSTRTLFPALFWMGYQVLIQQTLEQDSKQFLRHTKFSSA